MEKVNMGDFQHEINQIDWTNLLQAEKEDANLSFNAFHDTVGAIINRHMPLRKMTQKEHKQRYKPWITGGMLTSMMRRDSLLEKYIRLKDPIRKNTIHLEYKTLRNQITDLVRASKILN